MGKDFWSLPKIILFLYPWTARPRHSPPKIILVVHGRKTVVMILNPHYFWNMKIMSLNSTQSEFHVNFCQQKSMIQWDLNSKLVFFFFFFFFFNVGPPKEDLDYHLVNRLVFRLFIIKDDAISLTKKTSI